MSDAGIRDLAVAYARCADERDQDTFAQLFTPDGWLTISEGERQVAAFRGRDELPRVLDGLVRYERTLHVVSNHEISADAASGSVYCVANHLQRRDDGHENIRMLIRYDDRYAEVDGRRRFASRAVDILWIERVPALVGRLKA
jgi:SnoaL-like protein